MWNQYTKTTGLTFIPGTESDDIHSDRRELPWNAILELLSTHDERVSKEGALFMPVTWKDDSNLISNNRGSVRIDENVESINMTVLDLDKDGAMDDAMSLFSDFDYIMYSTHSYSKDEPYKTRIAIRHDEPLPASKLHDYMFNLAHCVNLDKACKNESRAFYLPSISTNAGIAPLVIVNNGRGITFEDSIILKETRPKQRTPEEEKALNNIFNKVKTYDSSESSLSSFSTGEYSSSDSMFSFDFEDLKEEFSSAINSRLRNEDSRWQFTRTVIYRAVDANKEKVDWHNLIQFLHQITRTEGTKQFQDGDTTKQLDGLIRTTFDKLMPDYIRNNPGYADSVMTIVNKACNQARKSMNTGVWHYNENPVKRKVKDAGLGVDQDFSYEVLLDRNKSSDFMLRKDDDVLGYVIDVIQKEIKASGKDVNINAVGEFALVRAGKYLKQRKENISIYKDAIFNEVTIAEVDPSGVLSGKERDDMSRFLKTALKLGYLSAIQKREVTMEKKVSNEAALNR